MQSQFQRLIDEKCRISVVSIQHLADLKREIEDRQNKGEFDAQFSQEYLFRFKFAPPEELENAESIIIVAMPRPPTRASFIWKRKLHSFTLPPTYTAYDEKRLFVERIVGEAVGKRGFGIATPNLPLKLLAVRSGLAEYGRNNIAYVSGMGSFMRLTAVYSDIPCSKDEWREASVMEECSICGDLCRKACPTGAISSDRFLIKAEKCLTYHNERKGSIPFPDWVQTSWHNCIIGCIRCQAACPVNKPFLKLVGETVEFDEAETKLLLEGVGRESVPVSTLKKMQLISLTDYFDELPRNLSALLGIKKTR